MASARSPSRIERRLYLAYTRICAAILDGELLKNHACGAQYGSDGQTFVEFGSRGMMDENDMDMLPARAAAARNG